MIAAATIRRRIQSGDTYSVIGAELGISGNAMRKRAARLGVKVTSVLGRHRGRPYLTVDEMRRRRIEKGRAT